MSPTATNTTKKRTPVKAAKPSSSKATAVDVLVPASILVRDISVDHIDSHPDNPRKDLGDITELAASIQEQGVLEPVLLVPGETGSGKFPPRYTVIAGHRRTAAARLAGVTTVPAIIREGMSEADQVEVMLVENLHRSDLTVFEEAHGMRALFDLGAKRSAIARRTGRALDTVGKRLRLANLPEAAESAVTNRTMTIDEALTLADIAGRDKGVYDDLIVKLDAGELKGWAITHALDDLTRADSNKEWMEYIDSTGVDQVSVDVRRTATNIENLALKLDDHMDCPGAAVYVSTWQYIPKKKQTEWLCTDAATHHADAWEKLQAKNTVAYGGVSDEEREAREQLNNDLIAAAEARWSWICHLLTTTGPDRATQRSMIVSAVVDHATDPGGSDLGEVATLPENITWPNEPALALALTIVPAVDECVPSSDWEYRSTLAARHPSEETTRAHAVMKWLGVLEAAGYTLTGVEETTRDAFDKATTAEVV